MKWVDVNERKPPESIYKPVYCKEGKQRYSCKFHDGLFYNIETAFADYPSHWLDESPTQSQGNEQEEEVPSLKEINSMMDRLDKKLFPPTPQTESEGGGEKD